MATLSSRGDLVIKKLLRFYSNPRYLNIIMEIPHDGNHVSLRLLDYFVTNYTKQEKIWIDDVDIHDDYKKMLHGYNKDLFDPFCRKKRIILYTDETKTIYKDGKKIEKELSLIKDRKEILSMKKVKLKYELCPEGMEKSSQNGIITTIAQLHFFSWCIQRNVIMYIIRNSEKIQESMTSPEEDKKKSKNSVYKKEMKFRIVFS